MNTPAAEFMTRDRAARIVKCSEAAMQRALDALEIEPAITINFRGYYSQEQIEHAGTLIKLQLPPTAKGPTQ